MIVLYVLAYRYGYNNIWDSLGSVIVIIIIIVTENVEATASLMAIVTCRSEHRRI